MDNEQAMRTTLAREVAKVFKRFTNKDVAFALAFTLPENYQRAHWITNVSRHDGIKLMTDTALAMMAQQN